MRWDIFCTVIDNYGDIGVCWRLARQLADEYGHEVRLWLDEPRALRMLRGDLGDVCLEAPWQRVAGIAVWRWQPGTTPDEDANAPPVLSTPTVALPDVVIEAFGCELPESFRQTMRSMRHQTGKQPVWINLEYLSAEHWIEGCHGLASPQPGGLVKYFFFPGFTARTGGLLRERDAAMIDADTAHGVMREQALHDAIGPAAAVHLRADALRVSLFSYPTTALSSLIEAWAAHAGPLDCLIPAGHALQAACAALGRLALAPGEAENFGALRIIALPFVEQSQYDAVLRACAWNFVRGEDSFVRAQWAGMPLVWHIYPQEDDAHLDKLNAFLARYLEALPVPDAEAFRGLWLAWNSGSDCRAAWQASTASFTTLAAHARRWRDELAAMPDLAQQIMAFAEQHCQSPLAGG